MTSDQAPLRVRIAPAPSGMLHVGNLRTALYNWLHARGNDGVFILRIEDTDEQRATDEGMRGVIESLRWAGLDWDEGPNVGGDHGPYIQSERRDLHRAVTRRLLDRGDAYEDHATAEELEAWRRTQQEAGRAPVLKGPLRPEPRPGESDPPSIRMRTPDEGEVTVPELIRGDVSFDWENVGDYVIQRGDGSPTYPLANAVDDVSQGVSLVCRGEDLLSVTPRQLLLYEAFERDGLIDDALREVGRNPRDDAWSTPSSFAHLPLVVGEDRKPLSKRHGSVAVQEFRRQGFLPEVLLNYVALLGWAPADGRERLTVRELVEEFDLARVGKTSGAFDTDKLTAFNGERIRELEPDELARRLIPYLDGTYGAPVIASDPTDEEMETLRGLVPLVQERMQRLDEVQTYAAAFFVDEVEIDPGSVEKVLSKAGAAEALRAAAKRFERLEDWATDPIEEVLRGIVEDLDLSVRKVFQPVRVAVTGSHVSPPLFESMELIGRQASIARIRAAIPVAEEAAGAA